MNLIKFYFILLHIISYFVFLFFYFFYIFKNIFSLKILLDNNIYIILTNANNLNHVYYKFSKFYKEIYKFKVEIKILLYYFFLYFLKFISEIYKYSFNPYEFVSKFHKDIFGCNYIELDNIIIDFI